MKPLSSLSNRLVTLATLVSAALIPAAHAQTKFGYVNIGAGRTETVTVPIPYGGTLSTISVLTSGAANLDFNPAPGGTCAIGTVYADNSTCTVNVGFTPKTPGARYGGVILKVDGQYNQSFFSTAYVQGTGFGPQTSFTPGMQTELGTIPNLFDVEADAQGLVFYTAAEIPDEYGGGSPASVGTYGSFPELKGSGSYGPLIDPNQIVIDGAGNVCIDAQGQISSFVPVGPMTYQGNDSHLVCPYGFQTIAADGAGNLYTLYGPSKETLQPFGGYINAKIADFPEPVSGIAVDRDGNVFVANGELYKETPNSDGTYTQSLVPLTLTGVSTVSVDGLGNLYVTDTTAPYIYSSTAGLYKESLQTDGSYLQSPIDIGSLSLASTRIKSVDLFGNIYLGTLTDVPDFQAFYSTVSKIGYTQPPTLTFATASLGATSSDSPQIITIANSGNTPLTFSGITFPTDFSESSTGSTCTATSVVAAGASCTLAIDFTPMTPSTTTPEALTENVVITTNTLSHASTEQSINVTGSETIPASISVTPSSLAFGSSTVGSISAAQVVTLRNTGPTAIKIGTVALVGANTKSFLISAKTCTAMLNPGQSCTYSIESDPAKTGPLSASLGIADNVSGSPQYVTLSSTGN